MEQPGKCAFYIQDGEPVQERYPVHAHDSYEIFFLLSGTCRFITHDAEFSPPVGSATVMPLCEVHGLCVFDSPISYIAIQFTPDAVPDDPVIQALVQEIFHTAAGERKYFFRLTEASSTFIRESLLRLCRVQNEALFNESFFYYVTPILYELSRFGYTQTAGERHKNRANEHDIELFELITTYISAHLTEIQDLSFIETEFHYSIAHVNKLFRHMVTESTWQYIIHKRLDRASDMMLDGKSATAAAAACGFGDYSVFYRLFVKNYGITPSQLKKTMKKPSLLSNTAEEEDSRTDDSAAEDDSRADDLPED